MDPPPSASPLSSHPGFKVRMSSDEMLSQVLDWNLGCDTAVLNRLKDYSENMLKRAEAIKQECNSCVHDVDMLQTRVQSVTNQFLNLSNDQFVENCVEEFEERDLGNHSASPLVHQVKTKAEKEAELIKKMKESIQIGIKSNSLCDQPSSVPKVKTAHIIGTSKFFGSRFCGLLEGDRLRAAPVPETDIVIKSVSAMPSDNSLHPAHLSESISIPKKAPSSTDSEYLFQTRETAQSQLSKRESSLSSEDNFLGANRTPFTSSSNSVGTNNSHEPDLRKPTARPPISIIDDLNKVLQSRVPPPAADSDSEDEFKPRNETGRDLFADEEDIFSANAASTYPNRQTQITDSIFSQPPAIPNVPKQSTAKPVNSIADLIKAQSKLPELSQQRKAEAESVKKSVFLESDSDEEADLFSASSSARPATTTANYQNLFADNDDFLARPRAEPPPIPEEKKILPQKALAEASPTLANKNTLPESKQKQKQQRSIFDESDSDDDLFSTSSSKRGTSAASTDTEQPSVKALSSKKLPVSSDLFAPVTETKSTVIVEQAKIVPAHQSSTMSGLVKSAEVEEPRQGKTTDVSNLQASQEVIKSPVAEDSTGPKAEEPSRKAISQKLDNIFKKTGFQLPGFPPKRKPGGLKVTGETGDEAQVNDDSVNEASTPTQPTIPITYGVQNNSATVPLPPSPAEVISGAASESLQSPPPPSPTKGPPTDVDKETKENRPSRQISQSSLFQSDDDSLTRSFSSSSMEHKIDYEPPVTFDDPPLPSSNLLIGVAKNRAKIAHKRRKPTQKPVQTNESSESDWLQASSELSHDEIQEATGNEEAIIPPSASVERKHTVPIDQTSQAVPEVTPGTQTNMETSKHEPKPGPSSQFSNDEVPKTNSTIEAAETTVTAKLTPPNISSPVENEKHEFSTPKSEDRVEKVEPKVPPKLKEERTSTATDKVNKVSVTAVTGTHSRTTPARNNLTNAQGAEKSQEAKKQLKQSVFEDSDSDGDIFSSAKPKQTPSNVNGVSSSIFPHDTEAPIAKAQEPGNKAIQKAKAKQKSIFADSDSESGEDLFAPKAKQISAGNSTNKSGDLFSTAEDEDMFRPSVPNQSTSSSKNPEPLQEKTTEHGKLSKKTTSVKSQPPKLKQKSIFDDSDSDNDMFSTKSKTPKVRK